MKHTARLSDPTGFFLARTEIPGREPQICPPAYAPAKGQGLLRFPLRTACAPALQPTGNQPGTFSHGCGTALCETAPSRLTRMAPSPLQTVLGGRGDTQADT